VVVALATALASAARALLHVPDAEMLFLLGVLLVALASSRGASLYASVLSVAVYDFFFVPPSLTFEVEDARYVLTFAMMLGIGLVVSTLAHRVRLQEQAAREREQRTEVLYTLSRRFAAALTAADVAAVCTAAAHEVLGTPAVFLLPSGGDDLAPAAAAPANVAMTPNDLHVARWALLHGSPAGAGTGSFHLAPVLCVPLRPVVEVLAVLALQLGASLGPERRAFAEELCRQAALALERVRLGDEARRAALRADAEELRSTLLSSVSHDLRTPLAAITGAATTLREGDGLDRETRRELLDAICDEAEHLERLVRNLLDMTRLQSGAVQPRREWIPVDEVVGAALERLGRALDGREVTTSFADDLPLVSVDSVLLQQLFVNIFENAAKYTPAGSPIAIAAEVDGEGALVVEVADHGGGIPPGAEEVIFDRFRRARREPGGGFGLGLAIARAIAVAHGGTLTARNRSGGGATFRLRLPPGGPPPERAEAAP
jgi:two-component system sensor histidine kinase KdpD